MNNYFGEKWNKKILLKLIIILIVVLLLVVVSLFIYLNNGFNFFADTLPKNIDSAPYSIQTGRQALPKDYLISIDSTHSKQVLGVLLDQNTVVRYGENDDADQIPSFVDKAGAVWFRTEEIIDANSYDTYFIDRDETREEELFEAETEHLLPSLENDVSLPGNPGGEKFWSLGTSDNLNPTTSYSNDGPGNGLALNINIEDSTEPNRSLTFISDWLDFEENRTNIFSGWIKFDINLPDENANGTTELIRDRVRILYQVQEKEGQEESWQTIPKEIFSLNNSVSTNWEPIFSDNSNPKFSSDKSFRQMRIKMEIFDINGSISFSNFAFIKNQDIYQNHYIGQPAYSAHYYKDVIPQPQKIENQQNGKFELNDAENLFLVDNYQEYYQDHYDQDQLIVTKYLEDSWQNKMNQKLTVVNLSEAVNNKGIVVGDLENEI